MFVWRDVNVRRADQFNQILRTLEAVAKDHTGFDPEVLRQILQVHPVLVTFAPQHMRMSYTGYHVYNIAVARQDSWQGFYDVFYALIPREQAKCEQNILSLGSEAILVEIGVRERQIGDAMRNQIDLFDWNVEHFLQDLCGGLAHDDQAVRKRRDFLHHRALVGSWIAKHGVQRRDERYAQVPQQLQDMPAGNAAKDSIFVLEADQIDVAEIEKVRGLPVGSLTVLGQLEPHPDRIVVTLLRIVNRERQQLRRTVFRVYGVAQVGCKRRDSTTPRKIIPHDCDSIGERWARWRWCRCGWLFFQFERLHFDQCYGFWDRHHFRQRHSISCESMTCGRIAASLPTNHSLLMALASGLFCRILERVPAGGDDPVALLV